MEQAAELMPWGISTEKRFIFIHVPKTAGCAINVFLRDWMDVGSNHATITQIETWCRAHHVSVPWEAFRPFAVVRNPFDRFALGYFFERGKRVLRDISETQIQRLIDGGNLALRPQASWIDDRCRLLRYETLTRDLNDFMRDVGIPLNAEHMPVVHAIGIDEQFNDYFTEKDRQVIRNVYKEDFSLWEGTG